MKKISVVVVVLVFLVFTSSVANASNSFSEKLNLQKFANINSIALVKNFFIEKIHNINVIYHKLTQKTTSDVNTDTNIAFDDNSKREVNSKIDNTVKKTENELHTETQTNKSVCEKNSKPFITVLSPNGGESFALEQKITVKWKTCNIPDKMVEMHVGYYNPETGRRWERTVLKEPNYSTENDGVEFVDLPDNQELLGNDSEPGKYFKFSVTTNRVATICNYDGCNVRDLIDYSDNTFSVGIPNKKLDPSKNITLLYPNGGEVFNVDQSITVKWKSNNIPTNAPINISILRVDPLINGQEKPSTYSQTLLNEPDYVTPNDGVEVVDLSKASIITKNSLAKYSIHISTGATIYDYYSDGSDNSFIINH